MKTKKEIFNWWLDRGNIVDGSRNDFKSFKEEIDKELCWEKKEIRKGYFVVIITSSRRWKNPLYLLFYSPEDKESNAECCKIKGF